MTLDPFHRIPTTEGDPEDGGIVPVYVDIRDHFNFAGYAEAYYDHFCGNVRRGALDFDKDLVLSMARRWAVQILGEEAKILEWTISPLTHPPAAQHKLDGTDHFLHYKPSKLTGDYELVLERYCRLHASTEWFTVTSLAELGALLAGKDNR